MSEFDPLKPAVLHDQLNDQLVPSTTEYAGEWMEYARPHDDGVINWDGLLIDGWAEQSVVVRFDRAKEPA